MLHTVQLSSLLCNDSEECFVPNALLKVQVEVLHCIKGHLQYCCSCLGRCNILFQSQCRWTRAKMTSCTFTVLRCCAHCTCSMQVEVHRNDACLIGKTTPACITCS